MNKMNENCVKHIDSILTQVVNLSFNTRDSFHVFILHITHTLHQLQKPTPNTFQSISSSETRSVCKHSILTCLFGPCVSALRSVLMNLSALVDSGRDAGTAHSHRLVWCGVAVPPRLPVQDQDALVDRDWVQVLSIPVSWVWTGAEAAAALGLPQGGGDPVPHCGRPEQTARD